MLKYSSFFLVQLAIVLSDLVEDSIGDAPNFISGFGLTVLTSTQLNTRLYDVVVSSAAVRGNQSIRILVPKDYITSGTRRRYPVLHLLHGAYGNDKQWTTILEADSITSNVSLITVMPNGDPFGYYTNWVIPGILAPQNWRTFHMEQVVPWVDLNLRTVARKDGRAIAGLSMGGYGAMHYAESYSANFIYGASFSGTVDLLDPRTQNIIIALPGPLLPLVGPFGYSSTKPVSSNGWFAQSTITLATELVNITIALYTGDVGFAEHQLRFGTYHLRDTLLSLQIPVYFDDYGDGKSIGHACDGAHSFPCWNAALIDVLPRMMAVLAQEY